ncbi:hypothetical protein [Halobacterium zhouii]|uniref:hypothetical protein n=1 Tax=Halobacterium zhouii TaxID=2902624 RepID=UPI001E405940|nr:hypothetical protein [Halobacterium zhouii]
MSEPKSEAVSSNTMAERGGDSTLKIWVLVYASRWTLTIISILALFVGLVALMEFGPSTTMKILTTDDISTMFSAIVGAIITSVTLILTVTQLVISQEIGSLSEQNDRLEAQKEFRGRVESTLGLDVSPSEPATFFRALVEETAEQSTALRELADGNQFDGADEVTAYAEGVLEHAEMVREELRGAEFGSFSVLSAVLDYNYSQKIHDARRLKNEYGREIGEDVDAAIEELIETLRFFGPTRGFFKTIYFQWELIDVSRAMVYSALPVLGLSAYMILAFDAQDVAGTVAGIQNVYLVTSAAFAFSLTPFVLLLAYIIRILSVLKRTLAPGSFVLRSTDREEEIRWTE